MKGLIKGFLAFIKVPAAVFTFRLWPYYLLSGIISLGLGVILVYGSLNYGDDLANHLMTYAPWGNKLTWLTTVADWLGRVATIALSILLYKYIVLIVISPIMSPLSERIERRAVGAFQSSFFSITSFAREILRGIRITIRNLSRELFYTLVLILLSFIPGFAIITSPLIFIVQAYYAGFGNMDYYLERHYSVSGSVGFVKSHRGLAIANGSIYLALLLIPFLGFIIAPAVSATAATIGILDIEGKIHP
jgi:CysZ protein